MIKIQKIKRVEAGNLKGFASVDIDDITIHDFRIVQQPGQKAWVSMPQRSWKDSEGKVHYKNLIELPKNFKEEIEGEILKVWEGNDERQIVDF